MRPQVVWGALIGAGVGYEAWALRTDRHEHTLSVHTRSTFRTHTLPGRVLFTGAWIALSTWFVPHILRRPVTSEASASFYE